MPEGPSIVIIKETIDALHLKGKVVRHAEGYAKIDMDRLIGQEVTDFKSWGKHFLICFQNFTLRIHFLLFGSYLIDERKKTNPRLSLLFDKHEINFYVCSVTILDEPLNKIYDFSGDIMSDKWNSKHAFEKLRSQPKTLASDALLDQDIFAGSGNIVKNEVLFRTRIHPLSRIGAIPDKKLKEMIQEMPAYAFDFLKWKKEGTLKKHWEAYTKTVCPRCNIPFHKVYMGKGKRRSYFCENCQVKYADEE